MLGYTLLGHWAFYIISMPMVMMFHVTGFINAFTHTFGKKLEGSSSSATNVPIASFLTGGESYHANHHRNAKSGRVWKNMIQQNYFYLFLESQHELL